MNITQQAADANLETWKNLGASKRDKIVYDALFSGDNTVNTPMFSHNIQNTPATNLLIAKLTEIGVAGILCESLPRKSTLSSVSWNGVALPVMPAHKGIAYFGYLAALPESGE